MSFNLNNRIFHLCNMSRFESHILQAVEAQDRRGMIFFAFLHFIHMISGAGIDPCLNGVGVNIISNEGYSIKVTQNEPRIQKRQLMFWSSLVDLGHTEWHTVGPRLLSIRLEEIGPPHLCCLSLNSFESSRLVVADRYNEVASCTATDSDSGSSVYSDSDPGYTALSKWYPVKNLSGKTSHISVQLWRNNEHGKKDSHLYTIKFRAFAVKGRNIVITVHG
jgi:hypothetical protein